MPINYHRTTAAAPFKLFHNAIIVIIGATALLLGGCTIRPTQEDVTRTPTKDIVSRIRCEARIAVLDKAIQLLNDYDDPTGRAKALAASLVPYRGLPLAFDPRRLKSDPNVEGFYRRYINTAIAYDFTFDITEKNSSGAMVDPVRIITNGVVGVGVEGSNSLQRQNSRHFLISDNFGDLLADPKLICDPPEYLPENKVYPIAGSVGLRELIHSFIDLNESKELQPLDTSKAPSRFGDTLIFTTTFGGSVTPHIMLTAIDNRWGLSPPTNVSFGASRMDMHKLILGLSTQAEEKLRIFGAQRLQVPFLLPQPSDIVGPSRRKRPAALLNEQNARDIVNEQRYRNFLDRGTIVVPR